jgi:hypothetical protein
MYTMPLPSLIILPGFISHKYDNGGGSGGLYGKV